ncbi:putative glyoxalase/Bleomycin resistance protein/Dihydroxybiphenyl dioxygenase [Helianthus anomalus]
MAKQVVNVGREIVNQKDDASSPFLSLNHVSYVCRSVPTSVKFYTEVLGFVLIRRPSSFDFEGAWLFNHGIGIHLLEMEIAPTKTGVINPKDNHISFQCTDMGLIILKLEKMGIKYVTALVKEGGVEVNQLFFHDPDGYMIEICNCHVLPVLPITSCPTKKHKPLPQINHPKSSRDETSYFCGEDEVWMMDNLLIDMMGISF